MISYVKIGEETGCLDEVLKSLSRHYEQELEISETIRSAVTYPLLMLVMMAAVIVILLVKVLPVFQQVFRQMGLEMNNFSNGLLNAGNLISHYSAAALILVLVLMAGFAVLFFTDRGRTFLRRLSGRLPFIREIAVSTDYARLTQAIAMGLHSGMDHMITLEMAPGTDLSGICQGENPKSDPPFGRRRTSGGRTVGIRTLRGNGRQTDHSRTSRRCCR